MAKDILLDENDDLSILNGDFNIDDSETQEIGIILRLRQGELKSDPILGAHLQHFMKGKFDRTALEKTVKLHLERDNKNYEKTKEFINLNINNGQ